MKPAATLGLYAGALVVVFGAALALGSAVGPVGSAAPAPAAHGSSSASSGGPHSGPAPATTTDRGPGGLAVAEDGYALRLDEATHPVGRPAPLRFSLTGPDGGLVTELTPAHGKDLHLVVVRRDLTGYQHLHPSRDDQGRWQVPLTLAEPGPYKVFADFVPQGRQQGLTLAADLTAPGAYDPVPLAAPARTTSVDDYDVTLDGSLVPGTSSALTFTVRRDGRPVTDLEPYLGAYGHLVALREGDLAYLHVHPDGDVDDAGTPSGPDVVFSADVPSPARYRLFLDFAHGGVVRTAELTAEAPSAGNGSAPAPAAPKSSPAGPLPADHGDAPHGH